MSRQDAIGIGNGVWTLGTQRTEKRARMRPDAASASQTQDYFLLMDNERFDILSRIRGDALGCHTQVPAEHPALFRNEKPQHIRMWLLTCRDIFGQNSWQWEDEAQEIRYTRSWMKGKDVARVELTNRGQMTIDFGYTKQAG